MHANLHMNAICRTQNRSAVASSAYRSAVACAAYRSGEKMHDEKYSKTHDYTNKENVLHSAIVTPDHAPDWMKDRQALWNGVEAGEKRKDAQLAKEIILTLPRNLDLEQQKAVVAEFVKENITRRGLVADYAIHSPEASDGERNPHAHIMFTLRPVEGDGFGKKLTGYNGLDGRDTLQEMRFSYEAILNKASENAGSDVHFDLRNLKQKGIDREPQLKIGPKVNYLEKRGYETEWGKEVRLNKHQNNALTQNRQNVIHYQRQGGSGFKPAQLMESIREDVARKYYEVMYGHQHARSEEEQSNQRGWDYER